MADDLSPEQAPAERTDTERPTIVCLCGSTRFLDTYKQATMLETLNGKIVLSIGLDLRTDILPETETRPVEQVKRALDELHKRKIEIADEVLVLDVGGYVGTSTRSEIVHARCLGMDIRYWSHESTAIDAAMGEQGDNE